jgi:hypothetical protein
MVDLAEYPDADTVRVIWDNGDTSAVLMSYDLG